MTAHILIIDDDEFISAVTRDILEQCGYTVENADDGLSGWEKIDGDPSRFDLVLLDKKMPVLDGISLLKRIKSDNRFNELPVIMLTGEGQQDDIIEGLTAGAYYYLIKPSPEEVLKLVIKNALEDFRQKHELYALSGQHASSMNLLHLAEFRFKTLSQSRDLSLLLAEASGDPARTVNGYSELLINAVEHGNLGISYAEKTHLLREDRWESEVESRLRNPEYSGRAVNVILEKTPAACIVTISDQGAGFDWQAYMEFSPERVFDLHGRGIAMSRAASFDSLNYLGCGNSVVCTVAYASSGK